MSEGMIPIKKAIPIIVVAWILSLVTTLALVYVSPSIFPPLNTANISDEAIITTKLADGTVSSAKILDGTITATDLDDGSVVTLKIADGAITAVKIANGAVTSAKIADSAIITVDLANESVTSEKIADENVTTSKIAENAIVTVKLADGSVTSAKILDGTITAADIATGAISTVKIADGAVTTSKIADYAVTNLKLAPYAIPFNATNSTGSVSTTSTSWINMTGMSMNITLSRTSHLLIWFSSEAMLAASGDWLVVRAMVDSEEAYPPSTTTLVLTRVTGTDLGFYTITFFKLNESAGVHNVRIEWKSFGGTSATVGDRSLSVIALPA